MSDSKEMKKLEDKADLDAYYAPFLVVGPSAEIYWYSPITNEPVVIMKRASHA